jgi:hypothetical protein
VARASGWLEVFLDVRQIVQFNKLRHWQRAFWPSSALIYRAELFSQQRTDIGFCAKSLAHIGELGRALLSNDLTVFDDIVAPSSVPRPSSFPDIADLLAAQLTLPFSLSVQSACKRRRNRK